VELRRSHPVKLCLRAAAIRDQQRGHRVPTVAFQISRCAVIARDDQHVGVHRRDPRHDGVQFLGPLDLGVEVPVFPGAVGVLEVDEEKVVRVPILLEHFHLFCSSDWACPTISMPTNRASPLYIG
jgi:hypothetical protein